MMKTKIVLLLILFFSLFVSISPKPVQAITFAQCMAIWDSNRGFETEAQARTRCQEEVKESSRPSAADIKSYIKIGSYTINFPSGFAIGGLPTLYSLIQFIISLFFFFGTLLSLLFLIIGGIRWTTSGGDKEATAKARGTVTYALIGLVVLLLAFVILSVLQVFLGVSLGLPLIDQYRDPFLPQPRGPGQPF